MLVLHPRYVRCSNSIWRCTASAAADHQIVDHQIPVEPGHILSIHADKYAVDIDVQQGAHESIDLQVPRGTHVDTSSKQQTDVRVTNSQQGIPIITRVPERYVGLQIHTHGGNVTLQRITEAPVEIQTGGGALDLGSVKTTTATLHTHGGHVCGSVTGATVEVHTQGGPIDLRRLVANKAVIHSEGADIAVRAAYAQSLEMDTGGAAARLGIVDCGDQKTTPTHTNNPGLHLSTHGGAAVIESLDGDAYVHTNGGCMEVHCGARINHVVLQSNNGHVHVSLTQGMRCHLTVQAARLSLGQGIHIAQGDAHERGQHAHEGGQHAGGKGEPGQRKEGGGQLNTRVWGGAKGRLEALVVSDKQGGMKLVPIDGGGEGNGEHQEGLIEVDAGATGTVELQCKSSWFAHALQFSGRNGASS